MQGRVPQGGTLCLETTRVSMAGKKKTGNGICRVNRRELLQVGYSGAIGLGLPAVLNQGEVIEPLFSGA